MASGTAAAPQNGAAMQNPANLRSIEALLTRLAREADAPGSVAADAPSVAVGGVALEAAPARRPRVVLGVSGSVATVKASLLTHALLEFADVCIVSTRSALHFFDTSALPQEATPVLTDEDEWRHWRQVGDPVVHILLRRWADALVIAPLSANTLAKVAGGLCDNLLTCVVRAWDFRKPLLMVPAMNTFMWDSPFTQKHLEACRELGAQVIPPIIKRLACGDVGNGAMAEPADVAVACAGALRDAGFDVVGGSGKDEPLGVMPW
jgi:phosphopantothenoylcysteine decarboxylase